MKNDTGDQNMRAELDTADGGNRRDSYRVDDRVRLVVRPLEPAAFGELARALWRRREGGPLRGADAPTRPSPATLETLGRMQPEVHAWLLWLEDRLGAIEASGPSAAVDAIGGRGGTPAPDASRAAEGSEVDLSEGGIGFAPHEALEPGTLVALELGLSTRDTALELVGEVVRGAPGRGEGGGAARASVRFRELHPTDREALVAHIFAVQRERLRTRGAGRA